MVGKEYGVGEVFTDMRLCGTRSRFAGDLAAKYQDKKIIYGYAEPVYNRVRSRLWNLP